ILAIGAPDYSLARHGEAGARLDDPRQHRQELARPEATRVAANGEVDRDGLVAVGEAGADIGEVDRAAVGEPTLRVAVEPLRLEAQRLDPEALRVDDLEDDRIR